MTGRVFNIQRFSLHDGPGIRTTAFLAGCNLRCRWCHNPEGLSGKLLLQYDSKKCVGCGECVRVCPQGVHRIEDGAHTVAFSRCTGCGECVRVCPVQALSFSGREYEAAELTQLLTRDKAFYRKDGGVTFSGGEPLLQADFVAEAARLCRKQGVPTVAVDTAGNVSRACFEKVLPFVDHFLFDVKAGSDAVHFAGTGTHNTLILENLRWLDQQGKNIYIRVPVIPGINDSEEEIAAIGRLVKTLTSVRELRLLPYHTFGREKYKMLGYPEPECFSAPSEEQIQKLCLIAGCFETN